MRNETLEVTVADEVCLNPILILYFDIGDWNSVGQTYYSLQNALFRTEHILLI